MENLDPFFTINLYLKICRIANKYNPYFILKIFYWSKNLEKIAIYWRIDYNEHSMVKVLHSYPWDRLR